MLEAKDRELSISTKKIILKLIGKQPGFRGPGFDFLSRRFLEKKILVSSLRIESNHDSYKFVYGISSEILLDEEFVDIERMKRIIRAVQST